MLFSIDNKHLSKVLQVEILHVSFLKYSNFKKTNAIATTFCTVIMTIKFLLWVVPKIAPEIQNGGRLPSLKNG